MNPRDLSGRFCCLFCGGRHWHWWQVSRCRRASGGTRGD